MIEGVFESEYPLLIRTDFSNDIAWNKIIDKIKSSENEFEAVINFINDKTHDGLSINNLPKFTVEQEKHDFIFLADSISMTHAENPICCIDLAEEFGRCFRVLPSSVWAVSNNLFLVNMDFSDFANNTDVDGIYRC